jgi:hypothetical protein
VRGSGWSTPREKAKAFYGSGLVPLVVDGSAGRGTQRDDSGLDLLVAAEGLPRGRMDRDREFESVEIGLEREAHATSLDLARNPLKKAEARLDILHGKTAYSDVAREAMEGARFVIAVVGIVIP